LLYEINTIKRFLLMNPQSRRKFLRKGSLALAAGSSGLALACQKVEKK